MYGPSRPEVHRMHREAAQPPNPNRGGMILNMENGSSCPLPSCPARYGTLPSCAGLSVPYVPFQQEGSQKYSQSDALSNGTLFPGLNLPFHQAMKGKMSRANPALAELMALDFAIQELALYLDTHKWDQEALALLHFYLKLAKEGREKYEKLYGPITLGNVSSSSYNWSNDPWPWDVKGSVD